MLFQQTLTTFFALMSLVTLAATVFVVGVAVAAKFTQNEWVAAIRDSISKMGVLAAAVVTTTATAGSLYYSEVVGFVPCELCWIQRIFMYSLSIILIVAVLRKDNGIWIYGVVLATFGSIVSIYHTNIQAKGTSSGFCSLDAPCGERHIWEFGFVSIPFMAMTAFLFTVAVLIVAKNSATKTLDEPLNKKV